MQMGFNHPGCKAAQWGGVGWVWILRRCLGHASPGAGTAGARVLLPGHRAPWGAASGTLGNNCVVETF